MGGRGGHYWVPASRPAVSKPLQGVGLQAPSNWRTLSFPGMEGHRGGTCRGTQCLVTAIPKLAKCFSDLCGATSGDSLEAVTSWVSGSAGLKPNPWLSDDASALSWGRQQCLLGESRLYPKLQSIHRTQ